MRLGRAENEDGVTETMRPSRTAIDWVRWWPSSRKPHAPVSAGVPKTANENRSRGALAGAVAARRQHVLQQS